MKAKNYPTSLQIRVFPLGMTSHFYIWRDDDWTRAVTAFKAVAESEGIEIRPIASNGFEFKSDNAHKLAEIGASLGFSVGGIKTGFDRSGDCTANCQNGDHSRSLLCECSCGGSAHGRGSEIAETASRFTGMTSFIYANGKYLWQVNDDMETYV